MEITDLELILRGHGDWVILDVEYFPSRDDLGLNSTVRVGINLGGHMYRVSGVLEKRGGNVFG